jgi:hypothetical protein
LSDLLHIKEPPTPLVFLDTYTLHALDLKAMERIIWRKMQTNLHLLFIDQACDYDFMQLPPPS